MQKQNSHSKTHTHSLTHTNAHAQPLRLVHVLLHSCVLICSHEALQAVVIIEAQQADTSQEPSASRAMCSCVNASRERHSETLVDGHTEETPSLPPLPRVGCSPAELSHSPDPPSSLPPFALRRAKSGHILYICLPKPKYLKTWSLTREPATSIAVSCASQTS